MKGFSPSKSKANRTLTSSGSMENDENNLNGGKLIPQFENKKITYGNDFMSEVPRKKILAEIKQNQSVYNAQAHKKGVRDSSVKVYDPLTNYLSPRPQFLRFNPNRRREIFKRLGKELNSSLDSEEASDEEESSADSSLSPPKGSGVNQRNGGICEEDNVNVVDVYEAEEEEVEEIADSSHPPPNGNAVNQRNAGMSEEDNGSVDNGYEAEDEEEMEERGWCLRGILKFLFTLIACLLLRLYISPMNSPTVSPTQQTIWDSKDSGVLIKNRTLEFVSTELCGDCFFEVEDGGNNTIEEENYGETEAEIVEYLEWHEKEMVENENELSEEGIVDKSNEEGEIEEDIEAQIVENLECHEQDMVDEAAEFEGASPAGFEFKLDEFEHFIDTKTDENIDGGILLDMEALSSSYIGLDEDEDNVNKDEAAETEIIHGGVVDSEAESSEQLISPKTVEIEDASGYMLELDIDSSSQLPEPQLSLKSISEVESKGTDDTGSHEELSDDYMDDVDDIEDDTEVGIEKSEWNTVVGVSAVLLVVSTSLAIIYHSRKSRRSTSSKESEPSPKQKLAVEEKVSPVLPPIDRKVEFLARASLPSHSMGEAPRELASRIHAPIVELIGEIAVGQPSKARNLGKFQMIVSEDECNAAALSQKRGSLPRLVPGLSPPPSAIEPRPTISSTSYGSFSIERKISKKEGGQSREAMIGTTPVRRSSRIRNQQEVSSP